MFAEGDSLARLASRPVGHPAVTVDKEDVHTKHRGEAFTKQAGCLRDHITIKCTFIRHEFPWVPRGYWR